jgi:hypothetical protein
MSGIRKFGPFIFAIVLLAIVVYLVRKANLP